MMKEQLLHFIQGGSLKTN